MLSPDLVWSLGAVSLDVEIVQIQNLISASVTVLPGAFQISERSNNSNTISRSFKPSQDFAGGMMPFCLVNGGRMLIGITQYKSWRRVQEKTERLPTTFESMAWYCLSSDWDNHLNHKVNEFRVKGFISTFHFWKAWKCCNICDFGPCKHQNRDRLTLITIALAI